jgi:hypothetical protein
MIRVVFISVSFRLCQPSMFVVSFDGPTIGQAAAAAIGETTELASGRSRSRSPADHGTRRRDDRAISEFTEMATRHH